MPHKDCIAMILAGGKGERLGSLTNQTAKPIVYFGGKYRIIDFTLSNCAHSGIEAVGVLTQYKSVILHDYIHNGQAWEFNRTKGGAFMLPSTRCGNVYTGTADAVYQNIDFIDAFNPENVLILSGDHVYKMDYRKMLDFHRQTNADVTLSTVTVPWDDAPRFGIVNMNSSQQVVEFNEKPRSPKSNIASMGIYIFKWSKLKYYLRADHINRRSTYDFGHDIIPNALLSGERLFAYQFDGYWRDVGTVQSYWESNMDLIRDVPPIDLYDDNWRIMTRTEHYAPCYLSSGAEVKRSIVADGCHVYGKLNNSILFNSVVVEEGAEINDSILMPGVIVSRGAKINKTIIGSDVYVGDDVEIGAEEGVNAFLDDFICSKDITLIGPGVSIEKNYKLIKNSHIHDFKMAESIFV